MSAIKCQSVWMSVTKTTAFIQILLDILTEYEKVTADIKHIESSASAHIMTSEYFKKRSRRSSWLCLRIGLPMFTCRFSSQLMILLRAACLCFPVAPICHCQCTVVILNSQPTGQIWPLIRCWGGPLSIFLFTINWFIQFSLNRGSHMPVLDDGLK